MTARKRSSRKSSIAAATGEPRLPRPPKPIDIVGTFDIECASWDRFVLGATYDGDEVTIFRDGDQMIDSMRERGKTWAGHAAGVYDSMYVLERCRRRNIPCQVDTSQHRVTRVVIGSLSIRDSYAMWPAGLPEICGAIGRRAAALPWKCTCGHGCGGYCRISVKMRAAGDPDLEDYVSADVRDLYDGIAFLRSWCMDHGIILRGTLGQTAWLNAQRELGVPDSDLSYALWRHARQADKGGRGVVIRPGLTKGPGAHHDICNAYPAQLAHEELPVGDCAELGASGASAALDRCRPGLYTLSVHVPDLFLPPLPWSKAGMITYPTGEISGTWTLPELVAAFERGVTVVAVHTALVWEATAPIFAPLVERWYALRREVGRKTPLGKWIGRLAKALTGKFAERPDRTRAIMNPATIKVCLRRGRCGGPDGCTGRCGAYQPLDTLGRIWLAPYNRLPTSAYPQWSSYLRAQTRVQWLAQAERMGRDLVMGNTDALWHCSRQTPEPLGDGLGEWEYQHAWEPLDVRSLTQYAWRNPATGTFHVAGFPEGSVSEADWRRGRGRIDRGVVTFRRAARDNQGLFRKRSRRWRLPEGEDRVWYLDRKLHSDGITYPVDAAELRELADAQKERRRGEDRRRAESTRRREAEYIDETEAEE